MISVTRLGPLSLPNFFIHGSFPPLFTAVGESHSDNNYHCNDEIPIQKA